MCLDSGAQRRKRLTCWAETQESKSESHWLYIRCMLIRRLAVAFILTALRRRQSMFWFSCCTLGKKRIKDRCIMVHIQQDRAASSACEIRVESPWFINMLYRAIRSSWPWPCSSQSRSKNLHDYGTLRCR
jgi:hypothetical protein